MKHLHKLGLLLMVCGVGLLIFYAAARIHEFIFYRIAIGQFEKLKDEAVTSDSTQEKSIAPLPLAVPAPDYSSWSSARIRHYEASLAAKVSPPIALLRIARVNVEAPVLEGTDDLTLNRGLGRIPGTARPGEIGNIGIAGHRDGFFRELKDIKLGDRIELETPQGTATYIVDHLQIVNPAEVNVLQSGSTSSLTLVTCYPFYFIGSAPQRFIVHAALVSASSSSQSVM
jgi:sortase A